MSSKIDALLEDSGGEQPGGPRQGSDFQNLQGRWVQTSLLQAQIFMLDFQASRWLMEKDVARQSRHRHDKRADLGTLRASDRRARTDPNPDTVANRPSVQLPLTSIVLTNMPLTLLLSSGRPPSAIALVRVSGSQAGKIVTALAGKLPSPRMATRALLGDVGQRPIDDAVVLWFPGPASLRRSERARVYFRIDCAMEIDRAFLIHMMHGLQMNDSMEPITSSDQSVEGLIDLRRLDYLWAKKFERRAELLGLG